MDTHRMNSQPEQPAAAAFTTPFAWLQSGLEPLPWFPFTVAASRGHTDQAGRIARRAEQAYWFLRRLLDVTPRFRLLVLDRADWTRHAHVSVYGIAHVAAGGHLVMGSAPAAAWSDVSRYLAASLRPSTLRALNKVHGLDGSTGGPDLRALSETLIAHELAHLLAAQAGVTFPRRWLAEAFANLALVAVLGETDPAGLHLVGTLVEAARELESDLPTLADFNDEAAAMSVGSSVLAQLVLTRCAYQAYAGAQGAPLAALFRRFRDTPGELAARHTDQELGRVLGRDIDPALGAIPDAFALPAAARFGHAA